ncbi:glyoxylase-like metal-dependent hydrolase (beta-lactamase superfamily II) [Friedmanniella endophytica]|uniref:Glyoxylase-like metal-dependent hydrolase (Beta-lactamase superfamily II) n=1 Tax=Microlunatus kandeliicorticis TaxID=1759536 RepID=A0A7W3IRN2_9ACTN|nr:MBL fold metallo-hydrolase [Microlunatus kandeliicorticis]MBA8793982.1 glyoxylase-like metal-dependent hydrolase (beta-lactamase superfamily II) [Microlunatus kandeliicorticis]
MSATRLASDVVRLLAPNPGPMTLDGTNTWVIGDPHGGDGRVVVDPGPDDAGHLDRVAEVVGTDGPGVEIWVSHRHHDHTDGAQRLARRLGCPVRAADPAHRWSPRGAAVETAGLDLAPGHRHALGALGLTVVGSPGHTSDSVSFLLDRPDDSAWLLTGDTVLGRGTTVITHPDGDLGAYLDTLDRLRRLVDERRVGRILPGHGPVVDDPAAVLDQYARHRRERLDQVRAALAAGDRDAADVVRRVYADVDPAVAAAAEQSVRAQLDYLVRTGDGPT